MDLEKTPAEVLRIAELVKPILAGREPEIQGAVLAELLSLWLAGHYQGGQRLIDNLLALHVEHVRKLIPENVRMLRDSPRR
jgi:hypothetical protein